MVDDWTFEERQLYEQAVRSYLFTLIEHAEMHGRGWYHYQFDGREQGWSMLDIACDVAF